MVSTFIGLCAKMVSKMVRCDISGWFGECGDDCCV